MSKRIVHSTSKGGVNVITPVNPNKTVEEIAARIVPEGTSYKIIDETDLPKYNAFRNAWQLTGSKVTVNIEKAREIVHAKRRFVREQELEPFDNIIAKQIPGNDLTEVEAQRQAIRDKYNTIQDNIDAAYTTLKLNNILQSL